MAVYNRDEIKRLVDEIQQQTPENRPEGAAGLFNAAAVNKTPSVSPAIDEKPAAVIQQPAADTEKEAAVGWLTDDDKPAPVLQPAAPVEPAVQPPVQATGKKKENKDRKAKKERHYSWFTKTLLVIDVCAILCFAVAYGPLDFFRNWLVTTSLTTATHRYFAYVLYSQTTVKAIADANVTIEAGDKSDSSQIVFTDPSTVVTYTSVYDQQVLTKDAGNDLYKVIELSEDNYHGYVVAIYDPSKIDLVMAKSKYGDTMTTFAKNNNANVAINAGGYKRYANDVIYTKGNIIVDGQIYKNNGNANQMIGMKDNVLCLATQTAQDAVDNGWRWAVQFGPFLVVNGEKSTFKGNGGYGVQPRTAIGQRKDGIVLFVIIDGRSSNSKGISMPDLAEVMVRYGCYNAANLDGGGSTTLVVEGNLTNQPRGDGWGAISERHVYNALIVKE